MRVLWRIPQISQEFARRRIARFHSRRAVELHFENCSPASTIRGMETAQFISPERIVSYLDIQPGSVVADFGSGSGHYTMPLARRAGPEGKVYAFDILPQAVDLVRSQSRLTHLLNIDAIRADLEEPHGTHLKDGVCDLVLVSSILHQADDKAAILTEASRVLKPGRSLALIEWDETAVAGGPPREMRIPKSKAKDIIQAAGFVLDREFEAGSHHYGLLFRKQ